MNEGMILYIISENYKTQYVRAVSDIFKYDPVFWWRFIQTIKKYAQIKRAWKQLGDPSIGGEINKPWYIRVMEYNSAVKRNEGRNMDKPQNIMLKEESQTQRSVWCMFPFTWILEQTKQSRMLKSKTMFASGGCLGIGIDLEGGWGNFSGDRQDPISW